MRAQEFIPERKKKKSSRSTGGYFFPGYGYYGSGESGEGGGGGGESVNRGMAEGLESLDDLTAAYQHHVELSRKYRKKGNREKDQHHTTQAFNIIQQIWEHPDYKLEFTDDPHSSQKNDALSMKHDSRFNEQGVAENIDSNRNKAQRMIYKYFGQIYDYGDDDGLDYLDKQGDLWNQLMDKYNGEIEDIVAREPTAVLIQAAQELKGIAGDMKYELDEQGVAEGKEKNHWYDAGVKDATRGASPNPRTYLPTLKDKQAKHPEEVDFYMNGYKSVNQDVAENFADGRNPQDKGDSARHGIPKGATMAQLEKAAKAPGRKGQLARWQLNMRRGKKK